MYGQKQIFQCLGVIIVISILNFYRSAIRRDKEIQKGLTVKREQQEKVQIAASQVVHSLPKHSDSEEIESKQHCDTAECDAVKSMQFNAHEISDHPAHSADTEVDGRGGSGSGCGEKNKKSYSMTGKLQSTRKQLDMECQRNENDQNAYADSNKLNSGDDDGGTFETKNCEHKQRTEASTTIPTAIKSKASKRINKTKINGSSIEMIGVLTYIAVTILLVSLIKAAVDVSKHIRQKRQRNNMDDNELLRRCSLQEYSMVKQQQLQQQQQQQQQQNINTKRKSVPKITELIPQSSVDSGCNNPKIKEQSRRMSTNPQDYWNGSGITTEPGSPAKAGKLLAKLSPRRPSMDSVSEDDSSSPDVKRRVRMINRH